ncbi:MAG: hypothetical protein PF444_06100 [Bacteroidales bacterium]|jgi:hypothetical protein|nr:hypothetical protein [Bacteroidales bacterium]
MKQTIIYVGLSLMLLLSSCSEVTLSRADSTSDYGYYGETSKSGSLASFAISGNSLYTLNDGQLETYDISAPDQGIRKINGVVTKNGSPLYNLETIFPYRGYLCLGATDGMYIIDVSDPSQPKYISQYEHVVSCDPVVVQGDYAYVTLRGGNRCGQNLNQLQVIDISDVYHPTMVETLEMDSPYGLGVDGDFLFVCDAGNLKVIDNSNPLELALKEVFLDISAIDVIPYDSVLMVLGEGALNQYSYRVGQLTQLSSITNQNSAQ